MVVTGSLAQSGTQRAGSGGAECPQSGTRRAGPATGRYPASRSTQPAHSDRRIGGDRCQDFIRETRPPYGGWQRWRNLRKRPLSFHRLLRRRSRPNPVIGRREHLRQIDLLRIVAIVAVVGTHILIFAESSTAVGAQALTCCFQ